MQNHILVPVMCVIAMLPIVLVSNAYDKYELDPNVVRMDYAGVQYRSDARYNANVFEMRLHAVANAFTRGGERVYTQ